MATTAVASWMERASEAASRAAETEDGPEARIIDAAFECAGRYGLARTTMSDVARAARLSRQTVYRYFPNKHALISALVLREEARLIGLVRAAAAAEDDTRNGIRAGTLTTLCWLREHPLLDPIMSAEPGELLPFLTLEAHPVLALGMRAAEEIFEGRLPHVSREKLHRAAEAWARLMLSYAITRPTEPAEAIADQVADLLWSGLAGDR